MGLAAGMSLTSTSAMSKLMRRLRISLPKLKGILTLERIGADTNPENDWTVNLVVFLLPSGMIPIVGCNGICDHIGY
jgi:hypothetical protein